MEYRITEIIQEAPRVRRFKLLAERPFEHPFLPGQFIVLQMESATEGIVQRSYSISSVAPNNQEFELCIALAYHQLLLFKIKYEIKLTERPVNFTTYLFDIGQFVLPFAS